MHLNNSTCMFFKPICTSNSSTQFEFSFESSVREAAELRTNSLQWYSLQRMGCCWVQNHVRYVGAFGIDSQNCSNYVRIIIFFFCVFFCCILGLMKNYQKSTILVYSPFSRGSKAEICWEDPLFHIWLDEQNSRLEAGFLTINLRSYCVKSWCLILIPVLMMCSFCS